MKRGAAGLSLVEVLVVLVLAALLAALLVQGLGFFLERFESVQRVHRNAERDMLHQHWFATSVRGMVPYQQPSLRFAGDASGFAGTTTGPLAARAGLPVHARWRIDRSGDGVVVRYAEAEGAGRDAVLAWPVLAVDEAAFEYADQGMRWRADWPPRDARDVVPNMVRLVARLPDDAERRIVWQARVDVFPEPVLNQREAE